MTEGKKRGLVDLHVHTTYSDGIFTPEQVVEKASAMGLAALSITDHDCIEGVQPAIDAASGTSLEVIPGVELSCSRGSREMHILGYFIDHTSVQLVDRLERMKSNRVDRMKKMVELLRDKGLEVTEEMVFDGAEDGTIGRLHLARALSASGLVSSEQEAFDRYIGDGKSCQIKHERLDHVDAINMILESGGVPILAHPGTMDGDRDIPALIEAGVRGIEVYHSKHYPSTVRRYLAMAREGGLLITGGSDCHGHVSGRSIIGNVKVDYEVVERLREEAQRIREGS